MLTLKDLNEQNDRTVAKYKGQEVFLNLALIQKQNLTWDTVDKLVNTHVACLMIFDKMRNTDDVETLKKLAKEFDMIEFEQQKLWGFPQDAGFHKWYMVPKCSCPKMDNMDYRGTEIRIYDMACKIHGG